MKLSSKAVSGSLHNECISLHLRWLRRNKTRIFRDRDLEYADWQSSAFSFPQHKLSFCQSALLGFTLVSITCVGVHLVSPLQT